MLRHFGNKLAITLADLREKYSGQSGVWLAYAPPTRDELGNTSQLGYYEGLFEDVLHAAILDHGRAFFDGNWCGEIVPIVPKVISRRALSSTNAKG